MARFHCDSCGLDKNVPDKYVGRIIGCPRCKADVTITPELGALADEPPENILDATADDAGTAGEYAAAGPSRQTLEDDRIGTERKPEEAFDVPVVEKPSEQPYTEATDEISDGSGDPGIPPISKRPAIALTSDEQAQPERLSFFGTSILKNAFAGLLGGFNTVVFVLAFVVFIFDPVTVESDFPRAMSMGLVGAMLICLLTAFNSRIPFAMAGPETGSAAVLGLLALSVHERMSTVHPGVPLFPTIVASIILCGVVAGLIVYCIGKAGVGRWIRFIPHQVVGGLMAGIGVFYLRAVVESYAQGMPVYDRFLQLGGLEGSTQWVVALGLGVILFIALRKIRRFYVLPAVLLTAIATFYGWCFFSGISLTGAEKSGWLFQGFLFDPFWENYDGAFLLAIKWDVVREMTPFAAALAGLVASMLMLKVTDVETQSGRTLSMGNELSTIGQANIVASLAGGLSGSLSRGRTLANERAGASGPFAAVCAAVVCGAALYCIGMVMPYVPRFLPYGMLVFFGFKLLARWLVDTWGMFTRKDDYAILFLIFLLTVSQGLLLGMGVGAALAVFILVSRYGKVDVVKFTLSGATNHSNVDRAPSQLAILNSRGAQIYIMRLQGFVFLGAMYTLVRRIRERIADPEQPTLEFVILDFRLVNGLDSAVAIGFQQMKRMAHENGVSLIFTSIPFEVERQLEEGGFSLNEPDGSCRTFVDSDFALEWCEDRILEDEDALQVKEKTLQELLAGGFPVQDEIFLLMRFLERIEVRKGHYVFRQGDASDAMYFVESGMVNVQLELEGNKILRLKKMGAGTVVGEMGIYTDAPRSASIVAAEDCVLFRLSKKMLATMQAKQPHLVSDVHRFVVNLLAGRVFEANLKVRDLVK